MPCQTTLDQLRSFLSRDESEVEADPQLRAHISSCNECRSRLEWLTDDRSLIAAAQRAQRERHRLTESAELREALETVDSALGQCVTVNLERTSSASTFCDDTSLLDPSDDKSLLGTVGRYQIQAVRGRGGMSVVFSAWDPVLDRHVAIKILNTYRDVRTWQRFAREARSAARIEHDAVVPVYEVVERDGFPPALVMPLMSGGTLQQQLEQRTIAPREAAEITARIADGLAEVHANNQIHRDIKPGNILFDEKGNAKLSDFSLARRDQDEPLTQENVLPGTLSTLPPSCSPEAALIIDATSISSA